MTKDHLNKVREAIACLDEAIFLIPTDHIDREKRKLRDRFEDARDGLVEVREEIQVRLQAAENANRLFTRGI